MEQMKGRDTDARVRALDRAHVFHSWSAQESHRPVADRRRGGFVRLGLRGAALSRFLVAARQHEHRPSAPEGRRCHPGPGRPAVHRRPAVRLRRARRSGAAHRGNRSRRSRQGFLHERGRRGDRERDAPRAPSHGPHQGPRGLPLVSRLDDDGHQPDRRPASLGERLRQRRRRALLRALPLPLAIPRDERGRGVRPGARAPRPGGRIRGPDARRGDRPRDDPRHRRDHGAPTRLSRRGAGDL